jgi:acetyl-CoA carboxylase carboxyltransferase component
MTYDIEKQHRKGKLHAIERIEALVDQDSFMEIYSGAKHNCTAFGMDKKDIPYDGVITGFGTIHGRNVAIYAQDFTVSGGSLGKMHGDKIAELIDKAIQAKCPVIGINDSGGARIQEGVNSLAGFGNIFYQNVRASGYIPQISIIVGPCAGGAVYSPGITDFIFTVDHISYMFITGPKVVKSVLFQDITEDALGGPAIHATKSGVSHFRLASEIGCYALVKELLEYIPHYYGEPTAPRKFAFNKRKKYKDIESLLPTRASQGYDARKVIDCIADDDSFLEVHSEFAPNVVVGFSRIEGATIGIVANNPASLGGVMNCDASDKAARFIRYCDAFEVPILTLVDIPGFIPGPEEEQKGIIRHGAKLIYAYSEATVPKVTVITRKAYGGAYIAMCSKHIGADFVFAWPKSEIAVMGAEGAMEILYPQEAKAQNKAFLEQKCAEYRMDVMSPERASERGYINEVIWPVGTRKRVAACFKLLVAKRGGDAPAKKHGNIPL